MWLSGSRNCGRKRTEGGSGIRSGRLPRSESTGVHKEQERRRASEERADSRFQNAEPHKGSREGGCGAERQNTDPQAAKAQELGGFIRLGIIQENIMSVSQSVGPVPPRGRPVA